MSDFAVCGIYIDIFSQHNEALSMDVSLEVVFNKSAAQRREVQRPLCCSPLDMRLVANDEKSGASTPVVKLRVGWSPFKVPSGQRQYRGLSTCLETKYRILAPAL